MKKRNDGLYAAQVYLGKRDGKKRYKTVYGKTQREVKEKAAQLKIKLGKGIDITAADDKFKVWADRFLAIKAGEGLSQSHMTMLKSQCRHLSPLDDIPLKDVNIHNLQAIVNNLADWHDGKKPLAKRSLEGVKQAASQVFKLAIASRATDYNPAQYVKVPKDATVTTRDALDETRRGWVLDTPHRAQMAAMIMLYAGLRRGELLALTWADIDFDKRIIKVNKAINFDEAGRPTVGKTKTVAGNRTVNIPSILATFLQQKRLECPNSLYVMQTARGKLFTATAWEKLWRSYMNDLNVKYGYNGEESKYTGLEMRIQTFTAHQLRHTYATLLYLSGVDILTARNQLGHEDVKTTLGIYTHLEAIHKTESMNRFDEYLCQYGVSNGN